MDKEKKSEIHITNNFNAPIGQHIDHVDTINFRMDGDGNFHFGMVENVKEEEKPAVPADDGITAQLKPIFFGDEAEVRKFLSAIQGMKPTQITAKVNELVKSKIISDKSHKHDLWNVLHNNRLYNPTESNWNQQVD